MPSHEIFWIKCLNFHTTKAVFIFTMAGLVACLLLMETPRNLISLSFWPNLLTFFQFSCMFGMKIANRSTTNPKHYFLWLINNFYLDWVLANANINLYILDSKEPFWSRGATPQLSKVAIGHFRFTLLNLSVFGFSFVYHDKVKWTQQRNLLHFATYIVRMTLVLIKQCLNIWRIKAWYLILMRFITSYFNLNIIVGASGLDESIRAHIHVFRQSAFTLKVEINSEDAGRGGGFSPYTKVQILK